MNRLKLLNTLSYVLSAAIICFSLTVSYLFLAPVDVLKDWELRFAGDRLGLGQTVVIESSYSKVRDVTGVSKRYLECRNQNGIYIRYQLNEADANRQVGTGGTGIILTIPREIPEVTLPTSCHFYIVIDYKIYSFRTVTEKNTSRDFTLVASNAL